MTTTRLPRTGCMFGILFDDGPNRFQLMKLSHPKQYDYCIHGGCFGEDGLLRPDADGLGLGRVLDYLGVPYWGN